MPNEIIQVAVYKWVELSNGEKVKVLDRMMDATTWTDPTSGIVYKVPLGYNPQDTIERFEAPYNELIDASQALGHDINQLIDYRPRGPLDLQRSFNGQDFGGFVDDFRGIASFDYGLAGSTSALTTKMIKFAGGVVNAKNIFNKNVDTSGDYFNNPANIPNIENGVSYYHTNTIIPATSYFFTNQFKQDFNDIMSDIIKSLTDTFVPSVTKSSDFDYSQYYDTNYSNFGAYDLYEWAVVPPEGLPVGVCELPTWLESAIGLFSIGVHTRPFYSPLVLDLDGSGIELTRLGIGGENSSKTYFDMDNDGFAQRTAWVTGGDGLLALDRNNNGIIDNQSELFGEGRIDGTGDGLQQVQPAIPDGFVALRLLDSNTFMFINKKLTDLLTDSCIIANDNNRIKVQLKMVA